MAKYWCYFFFMLWFCYLIVSSILLFTKGFLLTRVTQKVNNSCLFFWEIPCPVDEANLNVYCSETDKVVDVLNDINSASSVCLPPKSRVVLVIVDALRFDFTLFNENNKSPLPYENKLPVIRDLQKKFPDKTRLWEFIADPPTTTMQRIKGLTTGSLPTFIDVGSNFATPEINEDNIIDQLVRNNRTVVYMGDDTWNGLYPGRFKRNYPYPSFNVWDLDTVDNGIISNLYKELKTDDWSLLIAHFLGVDHCGHRYGPNHPEMARKLGEINSVIQKIIETIDGNTTLMVIGDHGMTVTGDHGGESPNEITSALFLYSPKDVVNFMGFTRVKQVDLVPTLATLLGVPIPFSNLGILISDALPASHLHLNWQSSLFSYWSNAHQMMSYIRAYSENSDVFPKKILWEFHEKFSVFNSRIVGVSQENFREFTLDLREFLVDLREMCEQLWIQFDSLSMTRGLLFLFLSIAFVFIIIDGIPISRLSEIFVSNFLVCSYVSLFLAALFAWLLHFWGFVDDLLSTIFCYTCIVSQFMLVMMVIQNWELISLNWYDRSQKEKIPNLICRLILVFNLCGLFSNSFIIEESFVLLFLLNSIILLTSLNLIKKRSEIASKYKIVTIAIGILVLLRVSMYFWRCREEQQWCYAFHQQLNVKQETTKLQWILTVVCLGLFVTITKVWLRNCGNFNGYSLTVALAKYIPTVLVVCASGYWVLNRLPNGRKLVKPWQTNMLAWLVYGFSGLGIVVTVFKPLSVYILSQNDDSGNLIPKLFRQVKGMFNGEIAKGSVPIVCGLGTVYSAVYVIVGVYLTLLVALLLGDAIAPSVIITFLIAGFALITTSVMRLENAQSVEQLFEVPNISLLIWVGLSQYFFYGSGHQPTFPNIVWEAAFIGVGNNNFLQATLVIINTFSSYIIVGFLLPLILIAPFTVSVMIPSLVSKKNFLAQGDVLRGELWMYEGDSLMVTSAFAMCCKYIMCHGIRVFSSMLAATIHCRHLMVWNIFAPKLIFEAIGLFVTLITVFFTYLLLIRIHSKIDTFINELYKKSR